MGGLNTVLRLVPPSELQRDEEARLRAEMQARQNEPVILGLASYLRMCWDAALMAKRPIEQIMLRGKRQRNGEYEPDKLAEITRAGGSDIFMRLTEVKCRSAESWVRDILLDEGAPPWDLTATPIPDLNPDQVQECEQEFTKQLLLTMQQLGQSPDDIYSLKEMFREDFRMKLGQEAQEKADRMTDKIKDQFAEGGWYEGFNEFVTDLVTYPAAIMKGPVVRRQTMLEWGRDDTGKTAVNVVEKLAPESERVDPFRLYPEPGIGNVNEGYLFQHHPMPRSELAALVGVPGYDDDAIKELLNTGIGTNWFANYIETTKNDQERKFQSWMRPTAIYDALEFWGKISGKMLREWGMTAEQIPDDSKEYDANVWLVGNYVIKAMLNYDPLGEKPYAKTSFFKVPGAFWGMGIPEVIADIQAVCNASARALVNNMGIASGPQVEIAIDRLPPNEDVTQLFPWKIWQVYSDAGGQNVPATRFNQPDDRSGVLMAVYEKFTRLADEHSGIPAYVSGDISVTGAGRTSSGLSMLMGAAGKGIRQVVSHIDNDIIKVMVERQFVYNMRYDPDESIKGDVFVIPRGSVNLAMKETTDQRRIEFLNATANPLDAEIMGKDGRAAVLRQVAKGLYMPQDQVVPSREKMELNTKLAAAQPTPDGATAPQGTQPRGGLNTGSQQAAPKQLDPAGNPMGGQAGNTVTNMQTGRS